MKKIILILFVISAVSVNAQSLKDLLYSGKLKKDSNTVIRKGDDLSSKIDTSTKKPVEAEKIQTTVVARDSSMQSSATQSDPSANTGTTTTVPDATTPSNVSTAPRDNNKIWKDYIDSVSSDLKKEVLTSKKIKSGTYYLLVEYEIGPDGQTTVNNVSCSPESSFLQQQVKERLTTTSPQMIPLVTNGKARKVTKKYNLTLTKP